MEIPKNIFLAMVSRRALVPGQDDKTFGVNYYIVEKEFPSYLEPLIRSNLNSVELWAYDNGYMTYVVLDDGLLEWRLTGKLLKG
jgi:hypothetical protein